MKDDPSEGEFGLLIIGAALLTGGVVLSCFLEPLRWLVAAEIAGAGVAVLFGRAAILHIATAGSNQKSFATPERLTRVLQDTNLATSATRRRDADLFIFCQGVIAPELITERIREQIEPLTRAFQFTRKYELVIPPSTKDVFLPIMKTRKGEMYDDLKISIGLSSYQIQSFDKQSDVAGSYFSQLLTRVGLSRERRDAFVQEARSIIASGPPTAAQVAIPRRCTLFPHGDGPRDPRVVALQEALESEISFEQRPWLIGRVATGLYLLDELARFYVITIKVPPSKSIRSIPIDVSFRKIVSSEWMSNDKRMSVARVLDYLRLIAGVRTSRFQILIEPLYACRSYHVEVFGPVGTFLARQSFSLQGLGGSPYIRLRRRLGQRYAHLYARGGHLLRYRNGERALLYLDVAFVERTPGSVGVVTLSAWMTTILVWVAARVHRESPGVDVVALLVTLPPAVTAWLQLGKEHSPYVGLLTTRVVGGVTLVVSTLMAASYLGTLGKLEWAAALVGPGVSGFSALLLSSAGLAAAASSYAWGRRALLYGSMLAKSPEPKRRDVASV